MHVPLLVLIATSTLLVVVSSEHTAVVQRRHVISRAEMQPVRDSQLRRNLDSDSNSYDNYYWDDDASENNILTDVKDRVEQDFLDMWSNPPNQWGTEYWEVFGGALGLIFGLSLCFCIICFAPICFFNEKGPPEGDLQVEEPPPPPNGPTLETKVLSSGVMSSGGASRMSTKSKTQNPDGDALDQPILSDPVFGASVLGDQSKNGVGSMSGTETDVTPARPKRQRKSLWSEVVSVWSEFFTEVFTNQKYEEPYRKYKEKRHSSEPAASSEGKSSPRSRGRTKKYKAPSPRKNKAKKSEVEYETDASKELNHKVEKYQGMIV